MPDSSDHLVALLKQRKVLGNFGDVALQSEDLDAVLTEACRLVGEALERLVRVSPTAPLRPAKAQPERRLPLAAPARQDRPVLSRAALTASRE